MLLKRPLYKRWWFWVIAVIIIIVFMKMGGKKPETVTPAETTLTEALQKSVKQATAEKSSYKIGNMIKFDDSQWVVVGARNDGGTLRSNNMFQKDAKTEGKFIMVRFKVKNLTDKEDRIFDTPRLIDSSGREFREYDDQAFYIPDGAETLEMEALPAGMTKEFYAVYEVPADAKGLKFQARSLGVFGDKALIELDF